MCAPHAPRWEEQQQQWSQFGGAWALVGHQWWALRRLVHKGITRGWTITSFAHSHSLPSGILPLKLCHHGQLKQRAQREREEDCGDSVWPSDTFRPFIPAQSVQTKQCRQCMEPSIRNKWGELCFSAKTTKTTAWQPPKFRSGKTEWINVEWEKEHHYTGFALIWHQHPPTTA